MNEKNEPMINNFSRKRKKENMNKGRKNQRGWGGNRAFTETIGVVY